MAKINRNNIVVTPIRSNDLISNSNIIINENFELLCKMVNILNDQLMNDKRKDNYYPYEIDWKSDNSGIYFLETLYHKPDEKGTMYIDNDDNDDYEGHLNAIKSHNLPAATETKWGVLSTDTQKIKGIKSFINGIGIGEEISLYRTDSIKPKLAIHNPGNRSVKLCGIDYYYDESGNWTGGLKSIITNEVGNKFSSIEQTVDKIQFTVGDMNTKYNELTGSVQEISDSYARLKIESDRIESKVDNFKYEYDDTSLQNSLSDLNTAIKQTADKIELSASNLDKKWSDELDAKEATWSEQVADINVKYNGITSTVSDLQAQGEETQRNFSTIAQKVDSIEMSIQSISGTMTSDAYAVKVIEYLRPYLKKTDLGANVDYHCIKIGYYSDGISTTNDLPAWTPEYKYELAFDKTTKVCYQYTYKNSKWGWENLTAKSPRSDYDSDMIKAVLLLDGNDAVEDGTIRIYSDEPTGSYETHDLWVKDISTSDETIYVSEKNRNIGFDATDWKLPSKYSDNDEEISIDDINGLAAKLEQLNGKIDNVSAGGDGKITTYFGDGVPTTTGYPLYNDNLSSHKNDIYYDRTGDKYYIFDGTKWNEGNDSTLKSQLKKAAGSSSASDGNINFWVFEYEKNSSGVFKTTKDSNGKDIYVIKYPSGVKEGDYWLNVTYPPYVNQTENDSFDYFNETLIAKSDIPSNATNYMSYWTKTYEKQSIDKADLGVVKSYINEQIQNANLGGDSKVQMYFYNYLPTTSNAPANLWIKLGEESAHTGDLFYCTDDTKYNGNKYWEFDGENSRWVEKTNSEVYNMLKTASASQAAADGKMTIYVFGYNPDYFELTGETKVQTVKSAYKNEFESDPSKLKWYNLPNDYSKGDIWLNVIWPPTSKLTDSDNVYYNDTLKAIASVGTDDEFSIEQWGPYSDTGSEGRYASFKEVIDGFRTLVGATNESGTDFQTLVKQKADSWNVIASQTDVTGKLEAMGIDVTAKQIYIGGYTKDENGDIIGTDGGILKVATENLTISEDGKVKAKAFMIEPSNSDAFQTSEEVAWFQFENTTATNISGTPNILTPVLYWNVGNKQYKLDFSNLITDGLNTGRVVPDEYRDNKGDYVNVLIASDGYYHYDTDTGKKGNKIVSGELFKKVPTTFKSPNLNPIGKITLSGATTTNNEAYNIITNKSDVELWIQVEFNDDGTLKWDTNNFSTFMSIYQNSVYYAYETGTTNTKYVLKESIATLIKDGTTLRTSNAPKVTINSNTTATTNNILTTNLYSWEKVTGSVTSNKISLNLSGVSDQIIRI